MNKRKLKQEVSDSELLATYFESERKVYKTLESLRSRDFSFGNAKMRVRLRELLREHDVNKTPSQHSDMVFGNMDRPRILAFDIETSPELNYTWGRFKQFVSPVQVVRQSELLSIQCKAVGDGELTVYNFNRTNHSHGALVDIAWDLLNNADIVLAHNAWKFDVPMMNRFFLEAGLRPPSPYKIIDTLKEAKKNFKMPSNSLASIGQSLDLKQQKLTNEGFSLWLRCMLGTVNDGDIDNDAWSEMISYGNMDVLALEELYFRMRPWMRQHPNHNLYGEAEETVCPKCGSSDLSYVGDYHTSTASYHQMVCNNCGGYARERRTSLTKEKRESIITNSQ